MKIMRRINRAQAITKNHEEPRRKLRGSHSLYMLGFLAAHGIDINKALRDYEAHGQCVDAENLKTVVDYLKPQQCPTNN